MQDYSIIGKGLIRKDVCDKVLGKSYFAADIKFPDMLFGGVLRSEVASAKIIQIKIDKALAVKGVHAVLTHRDIPGENLIGVINKDEPVLVENKIRRIGDPIALVAADTKEALKRAIESVEVIFEETEGVFTIEHALKEDSPKLHGNANILSYKTLKHGDVETAFKKSDLIVENDYYTPMICHMFIEPEATVAKYEEGFLKCWSSTQNPHYHRDEIARVLNLPYSKVESIQATTGGGFGGKLDVSTQCHASLLAYYTKRPIKIVRAREESFVVSSKRHPHYMKYKTGVTKDGVLLAQDVTLLQDTGAYASYGLAVISRAIVHAQGPYYVPNVRVKATMVYTNNPVAGAMRGFGVPQVSVGHEGQMDAIAVALGIDPVEIRLKNCFVKGSVTGSGQVLTNSVGIKETIEKSATKAKQLINW